MPAEDAQDVSELAQELGHLADLENELSLAQRWVHGRITDVLDRLNERIGADADSRFYAETLAAIARGEDTIEGVARELNAAPADVEEAVHRLAERGLVAKEEGGWVVAGGTLA
jgi:ArsR family transcriptional regulator